MKDQLIDECIINELDKYKKSMDKVEVPSVFHDKLEYALTNLPNEQNSENVTIKKSRNKKLAIAASITIILGIGAISLPALAKNIPVINSFLEGKSIFEFRKSESNFGTDNPNLKEYTTKLNQSYIFNGITITVQEVSWDGNKVFVGYIIKGEKPLVLDSLGQPDVLSGHSKSINGKMPNSGGYDFEKINDKTYLLKEDIDMSNNGKIPDKFRFHTKFTEVSDIKGSWEFDFIVSQKDFKKECKTIKLNKKYKIDNNKLTIKRLSLTPISALLEMTSKSNNVNNDCGFFENHELLVTNEKDQLLKMPSQGYRAEKNHAEGRLEFIPDEINNSEKIKIMILKKTIDSLNAKDCKTRHEVSLNNNLLPKKITTKKFGSIIIKRLEIDKNKNRINFYFSSEKGYSNLLLKNIWVKDKNDPYNLDKVYGFMHFNSEYKNGEYKNHINFKDEKELNHILENYVIVIPDPSDCYEPLNEFETEIKLK